jgi:ABC-2 type transport system ATP-binding protein
MSKQPQPDASPPAMIEALSLTKYYGDFAAVVDVSFTVPRGQVAAFLGPNGAGKSTTMKLLTGYLAPSAGRARIIGHDMATDRLDGAARLGYLPEGSVVGKAIGKLSRGYRQRVGMAQVLLHEPDVLILDEPTAGLDPTQIHEVRETIRRLGQDKTVLLSTHILQEVEAMADRILMISEGRLVFDGTTADLLAGGRSLEQRFSELTTAAA